MRNYKDKVIELSPPQILLYSFLVAILIGTFLLKLPIATTDSISFLDALFTTTSAMTVTGLITVDTETVFTVFGQTIIMILIQLGGLGVMSYAVLIFLILGRKIGFMQRLVIQQALNQTTFGGLVLLIKRLFIFSIIIEGIGFVILALRWVPEYGWKQGLFASIFHSISAFNNAGFSVWSDGLVRYVGDPLVNIVISFLFILGGLGFTVLADIIKKRKFRRFSLHTKIMIIATLVINTMMFLLILMLEFNNEATLGSLPLADKLWGAYFQAVTPRTAGFNTLNIGELDQASIFIIIIAMFIGAGSASTGGGIKLTTFVVMILSVLTFLKGKDDIVLFRKTIRPSIIIRALAISTLGLFFVLMGTLILNVTENAPFMTILFEVVSAFGTVGLSMGLTMDLSSVGKVVIIIVMFIGKLGPLTLAFSVAQQQKARLRYPKEDVLTG